MAEQRAVGGTGLQWAASSAPVVFVLTSIASRQAWKYRDRAYRYCLYDIGHAWQALALGARAAGCDSFTMGHFEDDAVAAAPYFADFSGPRFVQLYLYVHRIDGIEPGVYKFWPERAELEKIKSGDQRVAAARLSLGQALAGNACVAFSMIGDLERAARAHGDRGYRYVHFEAGAIGQRLYLAAGALGLGATGIGAFYDEEVRRYLNLRPEQGQAIYHFAIGYPIPDTRLDASD